MDPSTGLDQSIEGAFAYYSGILFATLLVAERFMSIGMPVFLIDADEALSLVQ